MKRRGPKWLSETADFALALTLGLLLLTLIAIGGKSPEDRFLEWAKENGAQFGEYLEWPVSFPKTGRGVRARKTIEPKTAFLRLPKTLILNSRNALKVDETRRTLANQVYTDRESLGRHRHFDRMVIVLMREKALEDASFWKPYLDIVPGPDENSLIFWSEEELRDLENDAILEAREVFLEERESCWETVLFFLREQPDWFGELPSSEEDAYGDEERPDPSPQQMKNLERIKGLFEWSFNAIASRSFQLQDDPQEFNLIPFADLLNHHSMSTVGWGLRNDVFEMRLLPSSPRPVLEGAEVFNHYGDLTTDRTLLDYSFIVDENYLEEVTIDIPLDTPFIEDKRDLWDGSELDLDHFTKVSHLVQFCRIVTASETVLRSETAFDEPFRNVQREMNAFVDCAALLRSQLQGKSSLERDTAELKREDLPETKRLAIRYKSARKRLVLHYADFLDRAAREFLTCLPYPRAAQRPLFWYLRRLQQMSRSTVF
jgi:hypothetical protein